MKALLRELGGLLRQECELVIVLPAGRWVPTDPDAQIEDKRMTATLSVGQSWEIHDDEGLLYTVTRTR